MSDKTLSLSGEKNQVRPDTLDTHVQYACLLACICGTCVTESRRARLLFSVCLSFFFLSLRVKDSLALSTGERGAESVKPQALNPAYALPKPYAQPCQEVGQEAEPKPEP